MRDILALVIFCIGAWLIVSPILLTYWSFNPRKMPAQRNSRYFVFVSGILGIYVLFIKSFEAILFFIPSSWGGLNEYDEFVTMRYELAGSLAFFAMLYFIGMLSKQEEKAICEEALNRPSPHSLATMESTHQYELEESDDEDEDVFSEDEDETLDDEDDFIDDEDDFLDDEEDLLEAV